MKLNLRILIYLNPSNVNKTTHKFNLKSDSGFILVKNSILALNEIEDWHYYVLVPTECIDTCWEDKPANVTLVEYPYINDALNSRFHFDTNSLKNSFSNYTQDIDLIWTMLPEHAGALRAFANKRREEIPVFSYINWMDYKKKKGYEPSYLLRMVDGFLNSELVGIQSIHMLNYMRDDLLKEHNVDYTKTAIIHPKTNLLSYSSYLGDIVGFPHRISTESGYREIEPFIFEHLKHKLWITNINNALVKPNSMLIDESFDSHEEYYKRLASIRYGISYHTGYSMWSMSVLDMMACGKVVLVPKKNAFPEMFSRDYPFFFEDEEEFIEKLNFLETCEDETLQYWGRVNRGIVQTELTWEVQAKELSDYFNKLVHSKGNKKTPSVLEQIRKYKMVTKGDLINKNVTDFGRRCSRAWNKTRIELMRLGIKDDVRESLTTFYVPEYNPDYGIQERPEKIKTPYQLKMEADREND